MKPNVPILKLAKIICTEDISPRSEELLEGVETKQSPFLFQTNHFAEKNNFNHSSFKTLDDPNLRIIELQQREIIELKEENRKIQKKVEGIERELKSLKRLRILLREKDRKIKELEESILDVTEKISQTDAGLSAVPVRPMKSKEYYLKNPPRRVWKNPVPLVYSNLELIKSLISNLNETK